MVTFVPHIGLALKGKSSSNSFKSFNLSNS